MKIQKITNPIILEMRKSAEKFNVEFEYLFRTYFYLSYKDKKILFTESMPETTDAIHYRITENKLLCNKFLKKGGYPVLSMEKYENMDQANKFLEKNEEIVVKPANGIHGKGISVGITKKSELEEAISLAEENDSKKEVLLEKFSKGDDYRILVVGKKKVFVSRREPAFIIGDGISTINDLIDARNRKLMERYRVKKDELTIKNLSKKRLDLNSIPKEGSKIFLRKTANIKSGGTATDCTNVVSEKIKQSAINVSKYLNMDVVGVDIITEDIRGNQFNFIEMNAYPGILLHIYPPKGKSYPVADEIIKYFFFPDKFK